MYGGERKLVVDGYIDASFQTDYDKSDHNQGMSSFLNGGVVSLRSFK